VAADTETSPSKHQGGEPLNTSPLFGKYFHSGYVVVNLEKVMANMRRDFGVTDWKVLPLPAGSPATAIAMAYVRGAMIELVEVDTGQELMSIFDGWLPDTVDGARLNHVAYMMDSEEQWRAAQARFGDLGIALPVVMKFGDIFDYFYADTIAQLGHFSEFVCLGPEGREFLASIPRIGDG
jgi:hypothetical protein